MLSYIRDCLALAFVIGMFGLIFWHTIRVEFAFLFEDNKPADKPAPVRKKFNGSAATYVR
jgi:hypothetical protein